MVQKYICHQQQKNFTVLNLIIFCNVLLFLDYFALPVYAQIVKVYKQSVLAYMSHHTFVNLQQTTSE